MRLASHQSIESKKTIVLDVTQVKGGYSQGEGRVLTSKQLLYVRPSLYPLSYIHSTRG